MAIDELAKPALSRREQEVAALVVDGLTNREIAQRLFLSERTVDAHLEHIREKLRVNSRAQVAAWFVAQSHPRPAAQVAAPAVPNPVRTSGVRIAAAAATAVVMALGGLVLLTRNETSATPTGPIIKTVAGSTSSNLFGGDTGDNGPATSALLGAPWSVVAGPAGYLYIADADLGVLRRVDPAGTITTIAGGGTYPFVEGGFGPATDLNSISSIAVARDGEVYFANGSLVGRVARDLSLHRISTGSMNSPSFICFAPDGTLYISDTFDHTVWKRAPDGTLSLYAGNGTDGFGGDLGAATGAELSYPGGLALDPSGNLYIADIGNDRIRRVDASSNVITTVAGSRDTYGFGGDGGPANAALLSLPHGVAVAANGDIYIADTGNNRVRRVDARTHLITTIAGTGKAGFAGDSAAAVAAELFGPFGVTIDSGQNLFIADTGNHRVRIIHLAQSV
jgi:DNA-binding CsgD family transcriptional regulator/sugar lactone lactonase YvrE